ncbi:MAG: hypothetical protein Q7S20_06470 [Gemmatimonadaceae bacterium]|nr:hypothetical protein [Gemmatimonadaceae bacterium]
MVGSHCQYAVTDLSLGLHPFHHRERSTHCIRPRLEGKAISNRVERHGFVDGQVKLNPNFGFRVPNPGCYH